MKQYEVKIKEFWLSVKYIEVKVNAENEEQARKKAIEQANNSKEDDWSDTDTMEYTTQIEEIGEIETD